MKNKNKIQSERRFWMEGDEVKWEDVVCESANDLTPLPDKCRIVVVNDEVKNIFSQKIIDSNIMNIHLMKEMTIYAIGKVCEIELIKRGKKK